jgi:lipopolysaccharide transport system ATP-binding protein
MTRPIIEVEGLSKRYRLGQYGAATLREEVERFIERQLRRGDRGSGDAAKRRPVVADSEFWALKDVSFSVEAGEAVGIIGRNGAGKSTLLKILSRITEPTRGEARIRGRIASLLEVGTGFHPELTGRENVYLNGTLLGMTKAEVSAKFDEIVAFAEIERFLDTPVKRYSSGMYVRLAFAVAAHLEPEILVVDEVLAVGDVDFQRKCLGKMSEASRSGGRTVLFVSHDTGAIQTLCSRALVLENGVNAFVGEAADAVRFYLRNTVHQAVVDDFSHCARNGTGEARVLGIRLEGAGGAPQAQFRMGEPLEVVVKAHFPTPIQNPICGVNIDTDTGIVVADCRSSHYGLRFGTAHGSVEYRMRIESLALYPRSYVVEPWLTDSGCLSTFDWVRKAAAFAVTTGPGFLAGANVNADHGIAFIPTTWSACSA